MRRIVLLIILVAAAAPGLSAAPVLELDDDFPVRGEPVTVRLAGGDEDATYSFSVTYRPNSETSREEEVGEFNLDGTLRWTPLDAGITTISVADESGEVVYTRNIAVRFDSPPVTGLIIFLFAGLLLFGGSTTFMRRALES